MTKKMTRKLATVNDFWTKDQKNELQKFKAQFINPDGRPKTEATLYAQMVRAYLATQISMDIVPIYEAMRDQAIKGNVMAFIALTDRAFGKPTQAVEMSGKDGAPIVFMPLELMNKYALETQQDIKDVNSDVVKDIDVVKDVDK
jgi:hypothetical protein